MVSFDLVFYFHQHIFFLLHWMNIHWTWTKCREIQRKKIRKFLVGYAHEKVWTVHRINSFKWIIYSHHVNWDLFKKKLNQSLISQYLPIVDINISLKWLFRWTLQNDFIFVGILGDEGMKKKVISLNDEREREKQAKLDDMRKENKLKLLPNWQ